MRKFFTSRMRSMVLFFCGVLALVGIICPASWGQGIAIGQWRDHLPYNNAIAVSEVQGKIFCATQFALFSYDPVESSIQRYSKATGLSDIGIRAMRFNPQYNMLIVAYQSSNIDLISESKIHNIPDIKIKNMVGGKSINHIFIVDNKAYFACDFGIVVLNLEKKEISDTYYIGAGGGNTKVYALSSDGTRLFAATEEGIKSAQLSNPFLADFNAWYLHGAAENFSAGPTKLLEYFNGKLYAEKGDTLFAYNGNIWEFVFYENGWKHNSMTAANGKLYITSWQYDGTNVIARRISRIDGTGAITHLQPVGLSRPRQAFETANGTLWVADEWNGLMAIEGNNIQHIIPNGPAYMEVAHLTAHNGQIWATGGGVDNSWGFLYRENGIYHFANENWTNYNRWTHPKLDSLLDFVPITVNPINQHVFAGSYSGIAPGGGGVVEIFEGKVLEVYKSGNSSLQAVPATGFHQISGVATDKEGNLWVANRWVSAPISVKTLDGKWKAFQPALSQLTEYPTTSIMVDSYNQKWIILSNNGILVFDHNNTIENINDDRYKLLRTGEGNGNLPTLHTYAIAEDLNGIIWIGTAEGIAIFYCPDRIFSPEGCDAQRIIVTQNGYNQYLLETEVVTAIAIDGANRKWIGTQNSGVFLLSADGTQEILHFHTDNSPLLSNSIMDIAINHQTGEVFFATERGIISYKSTATMGGDKCGHVYVYPNPVRQHYEGLIAITGLVQNAKVKITDISGRLIYQTTALGGQVVWDGKDYNGKKAQTGIYLVFASNEDGSATCTTKFLIIN